MKKKLAETAAVILVIILTAGLFSQTAFSKPAEGKVGYEAQRTILSEDRYNVSEDELLQGLAVEEETDPDRPDSEEPGLADKNPEEAEPNGAVSEEGTNPSEDISEEGSDPSEDVSEEGSDPSEDVSEEGTDPSEDVSEEGSDPSEDVSEGTDPTEAVSEEETVSSEEDTVLETGDAEEKIEENAHLLATEMPEPTGLKKSKDANGNIVLSWNAVPGAGDYRVYRRKKATDKWEQLYDWVDGTTYTIPSNIYGEYTYTVSAVFASDWTEGPYGSNTIMICVVPDIEYYYAYGSDDIGFYTAGYTKDDVDGVQIFRRFEGGDWKRIKTIPWSSLSHDGYTSYKDKPSGSGKYQYRFRFYKGSTYGNYTKVADNTTAYYLDTPVIESISSKGDKVTVKWKSDAKAGKYLLDIYLKSGEYNSWYEQKKISKDKTSYTFRLPEQYRYGEEDLPYILALSATNSHTTSKQTERTVYNLKKPVLKSAIQPASTKITLSWKKIYGAAGYEICKYNETTKSFELLTKVEGGSNTSYTDTGLTPDTKYTYRIRAYRVNSKVKLYSVYSAQRDIYTLPAASTLKIVNDAVEKGLKPTIKQQSYRAGVMLEADGYTGGSWGYVSDISDFMDYKGIYTIAYEDDTYLYICRIDNSTLKVLKTLKITKKYPVVGGVTCDDEGNYYVAWGQWDSSEAKNIVTFAISKYNYSGKHVATTGAKGADNNVKGPFYAGNCAMTFDGDHLVCSFARQMFRSSDGLNHQASQVFAVNSKTMKKVNRYYNYASHSFDQRVLGVEDGGVLFADLGDAYPRGIQLNLTNGYDELVPFHFYGGLGQNFINAQLGDIVEVSTGFALFAASGKSLTSLEGGKQVFMQIVDKETMKSLLSASERSGTSDGSKVKDTGVKWLTNYKDGSEACNVQAVKMEHDRLLVLWQQIDNMGSLVGTYYMVVSASGTILQKATYMGKVDLNGTEELVYKDGYVYWSTSGYDDIIKIHKMNVTSGLGVIPDPVKLKTAASNGSLIKVTWEKASHANRYYVYRKEAGGSWKKIAVTSRLYYSDKTTKAGVRYYYTVKGYNSHKKLFGDFDKKGLKAQLIKLKMNKKTARMDLYSTLQLKITTTPSKVADASVKWSSSDKSVATVDAKGLVTAKKIGTAVITAESKDGCSKATCKIRVLFKDVKDSSVYYYKPVYWAAEQGIAGGMSDGTFRPEEDCTRKQMVIFLWRMQGKPAVSGTMKFNDAGKYEASSDTYKAILWGSKQGIIKGYSDGTFRPDESVSRRATLIMLYRLADKPAVSGAMPFKDVAAMNYATSSDSYRAILWGTQKGIAGGYSDGNFRPAEGCTRSHIVTFIYRYKN